MIPSSISIGMSQHDSARRRWLRIMPPVFLTYSLAYLDRANYGFGAAAGMAKTLHITGSRSALLGALFFLGYFFFQVPGASYARKHSVRNLVFWTQLAWGVLAALTGIIPIFWLLAVDRLLLGVAESFIMPSLLILLTDWFTAEERSRANTLLILGNPITVLWMSAVTGYLIKVVGWQVAFILEGVPSVIWAFFWLRLIRDKPDQACWMSEESKRALIAVLDKEQQHIPPVASVARALRMPNVLILSAQFFLWSVGIYGFILWLPSIIQKGGSQGIGITGLLSAVPYLLAAVLMVIVSYFSDRSRRRKRYIWPFLVGAAAAFFMSYLTVGQSFWLAYVFLVLAGAGMYAPYGPFFAYIPDMLPRNVSGQAMAFINSLGALGAFVGAWLVGVLQSATHNSEASFLAMALAIFLSGVLMLFVHSAGIAGVEPQP